MSWDQLPIFKGLPQYEINHALEQFNVMDVDAGDELIAEGERDGTLVVVISGELEVSTGDTVLGRARQGELIGEIALFAGGIRSASVRASQRSELLVLDPAGYEKLRVEHHPVAATLEEHALAILSDRLRKMRERIGARAIGTRIATRPQAGFFERISTMFGGGGVTPVQLHSAAVLQKSDLFADVPLDLLEQVGARMEALQFRPGHLLCTEGEEGDEMFLIASGEVDVVCQTQTGGVERLATLGAGDAFGMCTLVQPNQQRMASCVAKERVVALSMSQLQWAGLVHGTDWVGSILRVAMIRALAESLSYANAQLAEMDATRARAEEAERALKRAAAGTETNGRARA